VLELGVGVTGSPMSFTINFVRSLIAMEEQKDYGIIHGIIHGIGHWGDHTRGVLLWEAARQ